eukprot:COSAG02_NODE_67062_length_251_cov_0.503226_1_plen_29_part_10
MCVVVVRVLARGEVAARLQSARNVRPRRG